MDYLIFLNLNKKKSDIKRSSSCHTLQNSQTNNFSFWNRITEVFSFLIYWFKINMFHKYREQCFAVLKMKDGRLEKEQELELESKFWLGLVVEELELDHKLAWEQHKGLGFPHTWRQQHNQSWHRGHCRWQPGCDHQEGQHGSLHWWCI